MTEVKEKKNTQYFTQDAEDAIVLYNNTVDQNIEKLTVSRAY